MSTAEISILPGYLAGDRRPPLRIYVLGRFEIQQGQRLLESEQWRSGKARSLFKILLNRRNYQLSRQEALELLWPELDQARAANNLNQAVYSLRRTLEPDLERANQSVYLTTKGPKLQLQANLISWVDLEEFKRLAQQAQTAGNVTLFEEAAALYGGDYLPEDLYEDWTISRRENLRQQWVDMLLQMAKLYQNQGQEEKHLQCFHQVLETDFSNEEAAQQLMGALLRNGRREEALSFYRNFATKLQLRLNMEPMSQTRQLYQDIVYGKNSPRPGSGSERVVNFVPRPLTGERPASHPEWDSPTINALAHFDTGTGHVTKEAELIGRDREQQSWQQTLRLALTGQGGLTLFSGEAGVGKTTLAKHLAEMARQAGFHLLEIGRPVSPVEHPYQPVSDLIQQVLNLLTESERPSWLESWSPKMLKRLPPEVDRTVSSGGSEGEVSSSDDLLSLSSHLLATVERTRRLVLILEDLHHYSAAALRLVSHWLGAPGLQSLVILGTTRPGNAEMSGLKNWLADHGQSIQSLRRFTADETQQMLAELPLAPNLLEMVFTSSQGNPRLARQLLEGWQQENRLLLTANRWEWRTSDRLEPWPGLVLGQVRRIINELSAEAQVLLGLAALIGPRFRFEVLRRVVFEHQNGAGWWIELAPNRLAQVLTELSEAGIIEEHDAEYCFSYPLIAETVLAGLSYNQRKCWSEVIGQATNKTSLPE